jgi:hypothetical protein
VPVTEAEQIVRKVRGNGTPVWYVLAEDEGHGFTKSRMWTTCSLRKRCFSIATCSGGIDAVGRNSFSP